MKEKMDKLLNHISVNDELKKDILNRAVLQGDKEERSIGAGYHRSRMRIAVAAMICLLLIPGSAFAAHTYFKGVLTKEKDLKQYVSENVYEDSDEHVSMQVKELLSDEMVVMATIQYKALDEEGKQWLQSEQMKKMEASYLTIQPDTKEDTNKYGVNRAYGCTEMKKYRTDTERYYCVTVEADRWNPSMKNCILTYMLSDTDWRMGEKHTVSLDTSTNIPIYEYKLQAENHEVLGKYYEPTNIRLSRLSYVVYGQLDDEKFWNLSDEQQDKNSISYVTLLKEDGSGVSVGTDFQFGEIRQNSLTVKESKDYNCALVSDSLINLRENLLGMEKKSDKYQNDPAEYVGVRIGSRKKSVEYMFEK